MSARAALLAAGLIVSAAGCGSCRGREVVAAVDGGAVDASPEARAEPQAPASRCAGTPSELTLEGGASLEPGDAVVTPAGLVLSASLAREAGRAGVVLEVDLALKAARTVELGALSGGALPPRLFPADGGPWVAAYARGNEPRSFGARRGERPPTATRLLSIASLATGAPALVARVEQQADDSAAFDVLGTGRSAGLVAWDEDSDRVVRGVVKVAAFTEGRVGTAIVASPYEIDADSPKLARVGASVTLAWLAREVLDGDDGGADPQGAYLEAPGEERARQWVQVVKVDASSGRPEGAPVDVTPRGRSHATSFELLPREGVLEVFVHDAGAGERGGRLLRVAVKGREVGAAEELVDGGIGAAAPTHLGDGLFSFVDLAERAVLFDLGPPRRMTREPAARGGRFVARAPGALYSLAVEPDEGGRAVLRRHACP